MAERKPQLLYPHELALVASALREFSDVRLEEIADRLDPLPAPAPGVRVVNNHGAHGTIRTVDIDPDGESVMVIRWDDSNKAELANIGDYLTVNPADEPDAPADDTWHLTGTAEWALSLLWDSEYSIPCDSLHPDAIRAAETAEVVEDALTPNWVDAYEALTQALADGSPLVVRLIGEPKMCSPQLPPTVGDDPQP